MTLPSPPAASDIAASVYQAYQAASQLGQTRPVDRSRLLHQMADALEAAFDDILEANTLDLEACQDQELPPLICRWVKLTPLRLERTRDILRKLGDRTDPIQQVMRASFQQEHSQTYSQLMPLGVIAFIHEALPELGAIAAGLCLRAGNSIVLHGTPEARHSNSAITQALLQALEDGGAPRGALTCIEGRWPESVQELVTQDLWVDMVIPYGRPSLVQEVARQATAPVLRTCMGNCYLYWAASGSQDLVRSLVVDSHASEPDAVNAIEKVLICRDVNRSSIDLLCDGLREKGFRIRADEALREELPDLEPLHERDWSHSFLDKTVALKRVSGSEEAINWINHHSSGHADVVVTESYAESRVFSTGLRSALVHINASPRFSRNPRESSEVVLGMTNQKGYRRGRIGLENLTTIKQVVLGLERER